MGLCFTKPPDIDRQAGVTLWSVEVVPFYCTRIHQRYCILFRPLFLSTLIRLFRICAGVIVFCWFFFQFRWLFRLPLL